MPVSIRKKRAGRFSLEMEYLKISRLMFYNNMNNLGCCYLFVFV